MRVSDELTLPRVLGKETAVGLIPIRLEKDFRFIVRAGANLFFFCIFIPYSRQSN